MYRECKKCKGNLEVKENSTQTDDFFDFKSNFNRNYLKLEPRFISVKVKSNKGDQDLPFQEIIGETLDNSVIFSKSLKSLDNEETSQTGFTSKRAEVFETVGHSCLGRKYFAKTPDFFNSRDSLSHPLSLTPSLNPQDLESSYEKIYSNFECSSIFNSRESFKQLIVIEKNSLQNSLKKGC
jgi:hypothetical protein